MSTRRTVTIGIPIEVFQNLSRRGGHIELPIKTDWEELVATGRETFMVIIEAQKPSSLRPQ